MLNSEFSSMYLNLSTILGKRLANEYINNAYECLNIFYWDKKILADIFKRLSTGNAHKLDISADNIKNLYWQEYRKNDSSITQNKSCKLNICNGHGLVTGVKNGYDYAFKCPCIAGRNIKTNGDMETWGNHMITRGFTLKWDYNEVIKDTIPENIKDMMGACLCPF